MNGTIENNPIFWFIILLFLIICITSFFQMENKEEEIIIEDISELSVPITEQVLEEQEIKIEESNSIEFTEELITETEILTETPTEEPTSTPTEVPTETSTEMPIETPTETSIETINVTNLIGEPVATLWDLLKETENTPYKVTLTPTNDIINIEITETPTIIISEILENTDTIIVEDITKTLDFTEQPENIPTLTPSPVLTEKPSLEVIIFSSRKTQMLLGEPVYLTSELKNAEYYSSFKYQWECDKGNGWEIIEGANSDSYSFPASVESLSWSWHLIVYYK